MDDEIVDHSTKVLTSLVMPRVFLVIGIICFLLSVYMILSQKYLYLFTTTYATLGSLGLSGVIYYTRSRVIKDMRKKGLITDLEGPK